MLILNTVDYHHKITFRLADPSYRKLARVPTESTERKTTLLLKKSTLPEEIYTYKQVCPAGSRPPRIYGLQKINKEGVFSETHCQQHWRSYLPTLQVLGRTSQPTHREFGTPCEKLLPVRPVTGISTCRTKRSNG